MILGVIGRLAGHPTERLRGDLILAHRQATLAENRAHLDRVRKTAELGERFELGSRILVLLHTEQAHADIQT